jgi:integrase
MMGLRQGEALGLQWDRVNFADKTIELSWQLQTLDVEHGCVPSDPSLQVCGEPFKYKCPEVRIKDMPPGFEFVHLQNTLYLTRPKTERSKRKLPMPDALAQVLAVQWEQTKGEPNPHNLVWHEPDGRAITIVADSRNWAKAVERAGLPHFKLHSARHTTATLLKDMGVDQQIIMHLLGHTTEKTTAIYAAITDSVGREAIDKLGDLLQLN